LDVCKFTGGSRDDVISLDIGSETIFKLQKKENKPAVKGGIEVMKKQLTDMGKMSKLEIKGALIFGLVIFLWVTDRFHMSMFGFEVNAVMAAMVGGIITLMPKVGILKWNEADIPWHLMLFSAGAYAGGLALNDTELQPGQFNHYLQ
jgi:di/tricarboxylate transporter